MIGSLKGFSLSKPSYFAQKVTCASTKINLQMTLIVIDLSDLEPHKDFGFSRTSIM